MVSRLLRGSAIAAVAATVIGFGIGLAAGSPPDETVLPAARRLPSDLCARLGDVRPLFPAKVELRQTGLDEVRCHAEVDQNRQPTYTWAKLSITVTTYPAKLGTTADDEARRVFEGRPWQSVPNRVYQTKIRRDGRKTGVWAITVLVQRADTVVQVDYEALPVNGKVAEQALLALADKAIWEAK
jgi:hypothetical protein